VNGEKNDVFVEVAPWTFQRRHVELAEQLDKQVVVQRGLTAGERIVSENAVLLP